MKVLLAVDPSTRSEALVNEVASRPWPVGTQITVLNVLDVEDFLSAANYRENVRETENKAATSMVKEIARRLASPGVETFAKVIENYPALGIVDYAKEWGADLIFVGSHGHAGLGKFLIGSVARVVAHNAPCSVEIVRATTRDTSGAMKILLATDGSEFSNAAARSIAARPWPKGSEVKAVSVIDEALPVIDPWYTAGEWLEGHRAEKAREAEIAVEAAKNTLSASGLNATTELLMGGARWLILNEAREWGANLIALGSHGRRGMQRLLMGSVSEAVALHANCSVEITRAVAQPQAASIGAGK
jgi:nucleotide-binding universal stress UspA family protein